MIYFFYMHTTIRQKYMVLFYLCFFCAQPFDQKSGPSFISFFFFARDHSTKIYDLLSFIISFVYDHWTKNRIHTNLFLLFARNRSTKICGLHLFFLLWTTIGPKIRVLIDLIFFICTRLFDQIIWSSFIYSFFSAQPFNQKLGSSLTYLFHFHTTIRQKYSIWSSFFHFFFLCAQPFDQKLGPSLIYCFYLHTTID